MITGEDTVVVVGFADLSSTVNQMLALLGQRWPSMLVLVNDDEQPREFDDWRTDWGSLPRGSGNVMIARDAATLTTWDECGYFTDAAGEGPLMIYYEPCKDGLICASFREEPYVREAGYGFDPFEGLILGNGCSILTLVTPEDAPGLRDDVLALLRRAVSSPTSRP